MNARVALCGIAFILSLAGCQSKQDTSITQLRQKIAEQDKKIEEQSKKVETLQSDVESLKSNQAFSDSMRDWDRIAFLRPGAKGYSTIQSDYGTITVSLSDVRAYADGSRVTLQFGNATSATLTDVKATIEWGRVDSKDLPVNEEAKSKTVTFDRSLRAGAWTTVDVVLDGTPPTGVGFVRVRDVSNKGIILYR